MTIATIVLPIKVGEAAEKQEVLHQKIKGPLKMVRYVGGSTKRPAEKAVEALPVEA